MRRLIPFLGAGLCMIAAACGDGGKKAGADSVAQTHTGDSLPAPFATESTKKFSKVIGWDSSRTPTAPEGFTVTKFADGFNNPRWIYILPNGDILIAEASTKPKLKDKVAAVASGKSKSQNLGNSADRITLLRDSNGDGVPESRNTFLSGLNQPLGMLLLNNNFYVGNTDGILMYPYKENANTISGEGKKILELPAGGYNNHWTRNLLASKDGKHIYVSVGSASNVAEHGLEEEVRRAAILEINPDGTGERIFASGLRNPVGMDWAPGTNTLWTAVNERDELGDELVPDYMTSVKEGGFYGWPYSYFGQHEDPRMKGQGKELVAKAIVPDVPLGSHTASLGLAFYTGEAFPEKYRNGAFVGQHGSWNRSVLSGYKVVFVPFADGKAANGYEDFLTGFIADEPKGEVYGRPVGVAVAKDGSLLVADDASNTIWRVTYNK
ncbi:sorbosone dehydrogenase family protein [Chitinophaga horti]|uniref:Sorbosone dehydrogenase family protein n=1 Tax=Chitinophaga horti TaxID=2920382 RepID=A0ABY6J5G1_9BACT|nr:sorbosone dehydrogenase family protein [Chitinophaga horti]UYQ94591.1 sorbosone dehydrogenase family protein [Chitinophaga horti]